MYKGYPRSGWLPHFLEKSHTLLSEHLWREWFLCMWYPGPWHSVLILPHRTGTYPIVKRYIDSQAYIVRRITWQTADHVTTCGTSVCRLSRDPQSSTWSAWLCTLDYQYYAWLWDKCAGRWNGDTVNIFGVPNLFRSNSIYIVAMKFEFYKVWYSDYLQYHQSTFTHSIHSKGLSKFTNQKKILGILGILLNFVI